MSDKVRIHDLAKQYDMPGKDLASKLRDFGFSKAKSHMSALDPFELVQAQGLLEANGIMPVAGAGDDGEDAAGGGLRVKKRKKVKADDDSGSALPGIKKRKKAPAPGAEAPTQPAPAPPAEMPVPAAEEPGAPAAEEAPPAPEFTALEPEPAPEPVVAEPETEAVAAPEQLEAPVAPEAEEAEPAPAVAGAPEAPADPAPAAAGEPTTGEAEEPDASDDDPSSRKGNVVGFIDLSTIAASQPARRRPDSKRLQSRDDFTPDVRPTFGRDRGRQQGPTGPRGKMTAAELREREQGRFLRRNRAAGGPPGRRGSGGGGRSGSREQVTESPYSGGSVTIEEPITIAKLSDALALKSSVVQKRALERQYGMFTLNSTIDNDTATLLASEFEVELEVKQEITAEQQLIEEVAKKRSEVEEEHLVPRSPTVAFLGHVDHGKTTLIDKIRETKVADKEAGGITQHVGAYQVQTSKGHTVTIVDTPGHQAFTAMRARGAKAVDIVVLVVAGDDGVKPSTVEAINHAKAAETPIVVALNKADKPDFNANAVIQQLMGQELVPEQYGGTAAMFETSGMTGAGLDELLEHIFLMGDAELGLRAHPDGPASGVVLEAEIQQGRGIVAHLLVQDGTLSKGDVILAGAGYGKVRQLLDDRGKTLKTAGPSTPVAVTGLDALPGVGQPFNVIETLQQAKEIAEERERTARAKMLASKREPSRELEAILGSAPKTEREVINVIVRGDVQGTVEVIRQEIEALDHEEVEIKLVHSGVGPITESDVDLATTSDALLIAFHVSVNPKARQTAERGGLTVRRYNVIYELLDDLRRVMEGALKPEFEEEIVGHVEIRRIFKSSKIGLIAGCMVLDGSVKRSSKVRLLRDEQIVYTGQIGSLRREKEEAAEVRSGFECGIVLKDYRDIREGDIVEVFRMKEIKRTL
ncbi:MAG: translation initiation factor IF-2 [Planctomycetota bacterium]|nr:translation initiation factor IF-2 [Planctomycetota bacterium]